MKNIFEVLLQKEAEQVVLQKQVDALRMVLPLLAEPSDKPGEKLSEQRKQWP